MRYFLENEALKVEIDSFGAEVKSVINKANNREYMWYGNPKFWGRTSPVLFPFVGSVKNKEYRYKGKTYPMGQHGFARDNEHTLLEQTDTRLTFSFCSSEKTREVFPFDFELQCGYELVGNELKVIWKVINPSDDVLYFSVGAHPAFLCPVNGEKDKCGYKLYFEGINEVVHHGNTPAGMAIMDNETLPLDNGRVSITSDFFDKCTYMIENNQTGLVGIETPEGNRIVDVKFNTPLFAIWSPEKKNAPFICIEPWYGRCDREDFDGEINERDYTNTLESKGCFEGGYSMVFHKV